MAAMMIQKAATIAHIDEASAEWGGLTRRRARTDLRRLEIPLRSRHASVAELELAEGEHLGEMDGYDDPVVERFYEEPEIPKTSWLDGDARDSALSQLLAEEDRADRLADESWWRKPWSDSWPWECLFPRPHESTCDCAACRIYLAEVARRSELIRIEKEEQEKAARERHEQWELEHGQAWRKVQEYKKRIAASAVSVSLQQQRINAESVGLSISWANALERQVLCRTANGFFVRWRDSLWEFNWRPGIDDNLRVGSIVYITPLGQIYVGPQ